MAGGAWLRPGVVLGPPRMNGDARPSKEKPDDINCELPRLVDPFRPLHRTSGVGGICGSEVLRSDSRTCRVCIKGDSSESWPNMDEQPLSGRTWPGMYSSESEMLPPKFLWQSFRPYCVRRTKRLLRTRASGIIVDAMTGSARVLATL